MTLQQAPGPRIYRVRILEDGQHRHEELTLDGVLELARGRSYGARPTTWRPLTELGAAHHVKRLAWLLGRHAFRRGLRCGARSWAKDCNNVGPLTAATREAWWNGWHHEEGGEG